MSFSIYTAGGLLDSLFGQSSDFGALASAPTIYVALSSVDPGADGSDLTEPSGVGYARVTTSATDWGTASAASPVELSNVSAIVFNQATGDWGSLTYFALVDAATGGHVLASGALDIAKEPTQGDTPRFESGALSITLS